MGGHIFFQLRTDATLDIGGRRLYNTASPLFEKDAGAV